MLDLDKHSIYKIILCKSQSKWEYKIFVSDQKKMCSPFNIDIRPRRLPIEVRHIEEASSGHGIIFIFWRTKKKPNNLQFSYNTRILIVSGIHCFVNGDNYEKIDAIIPGPKETPYEGVNFRLSMEFNDQYPFRPPTIKFQTPVYHPNIDTGKAKNCIPFDAAGNLIINEF